MAISDVTEYMHLTDEQVEELGRVVHKVCSERLEKLNAEAGKGS